MKWRLYTKRLINTGPQKNTVVGGKYLKVKGMRSSYVMPQHEGFIIAIKYKK